jgi:DNA-binding response OmpR family regulator
MSKSKILYVEDEPFLAKIVKDSLESRDFEVHLLTDGRDVLATADTFGPDLCLLDVMLPHRDGYALAQDLRRARAHLPIIFLTAKSQTEDVLKGFDSGGNDFLRKPFSLEELIARIHNLLNLAGPKNAAPQAAIFVGKYEFAPHRYELKLGTETRKLSHREAELIKIFADNQNRIINRKDILMRVWNDDSFFNSRNLDVYITKLRHYLKDDPSVQIISIKSVGYHFLVENMPS